MIDIVTSVFSLVNDWGFFVPKLDIHYIEKETCIEWFINCGGTRAYLIRIGTGLGSDFEDECADSHFMVNRVVTALFLGGLGLFKATSMGRVIFNNIESDEVNFITHLDLRDIEKSETDEGTNSFTDWYRFICQNDLFRRAADDAYHALLNPVESIFYMYRGMEWLLKAGAIGWRELADDMGVTFNQIKDFKRMANFEFGQRHGIGSARKMRAQFRESGMLVADLLYGLCKVRKRVDSSYEVPTPNDVSKIVMKALPTGPYP